MSDADNDALTKRYIRVAGQRDAALARVAELEAAIRAYRDAYGCVDGGRGICAIDRDMRVVPLDKIDCTECRAMLALEALVATQKEGGDAQEKKR